MKLSRVGFEVQRTSLPGKPIGLEENGVSDGGDDEKPEIIGV